VALSSDARWALIGGHDWSKKEGDVLLWDVSTGREIRRFARSAASIKSVAFASEGRQALTGDWEGAARLWDLDTGKELHSFVTREPYGIESVAMSLDGRWVLTSNGSNNTATVWNVETEKQVHTLPGHSAAVTSVAFSRDGRRWLTGSWDHTAKLWDARTGHELRAFVGHAGPVTKAVFSPDGRRVLTSSFDGTARVWDADSGNHLATLVSFQDGTWAVVDPSGRFDAANGGDVDGLHWVVDNRPIALSQLKERYYEPGLLAKVMSFDHAPVRQVERFRAPKLFPLVQLSAPPAESTRLKIQLRNQGGGIGKVQVLINGKEIRADARGLATDPRAAQASLEVNLEGPAVKPGQDNRVEVIAWNAEGYLSSRGAQLLWRAPGAKDLEPPEIFAIVGGTARYGAASMNLTFAGKDAADMATALRVSAGRLFGAKKVHLALLSDYPGTKGAQLPSRDNLRHAFEAARKARPGDILVVYLAGHGATAPDGEYWYLTREARSADLTDPQVRAISGVSSEQLTDWIKTIPATKQVMVLDTCAAGAAATRLTDVRALSSDQVRAITRLQDRTGLHVLMGSAADAASYEASQFGQGILTYTLLQGMRGAALREGQYVDVARLFEHATDEVPRLARSVGGIQRPIISAPKGASFDIGQLTTEDKPLIPLPMARPMILRSSFQSEAPPFADGLELSRRINAELRELADPAARGGAIVFIDGDELPGALRLTGRYREEGPTIRLDSYLLDGKTVRGHFEVGGQATDLDGLARALVKKAEEASARSP
jgi:hypothetical protein